MLCRGFCGFAAVQSGALRFALMPFQLFTLPELLTLKALLPLPRFAERSRTLRPNSLQPFFMSERFIPLCIILVPVPAALPDVTHGITPAYAGKR